MGTTPERWSRIKQLFADVSELPEGERRAWLAREAGDDPSVIAEVESLLDWNDRPDPFRDSAPQELYAEIFTPAATSRAGERIGAYRIEELVGTGGMGDVYKAMRDDDVYHAEVAIKIMRSDVCNPGAAQRFRAERQILAALDHRNIARLLDGGTTPNGLPYVVMELVDGEPIDAYCKAHELATRERVKLFLQVCAAVAYAHQRLVVHRDLKPNNILVTEDGSVKLLDFGIAKLLENDSPTVPRADLTAMHMGMMTLDYASPEQVSGGTITTVSDVYSLGVVLYWLLTGQSPYSARGSEAQRVAEIIGDTTPRRPSLVKTEEHAYRGDIDADLDSILLMALRKEPHKRYGTVEQLATDLRNYLAGLPVAARRGSFGYHLTKFARRHKAEIALAAAVVVALVGGLFFTIREARIANEQRRVAQLHFDSVRKLANRLFDFHDDIAQLPNSTKARERLVTTALEYLDALNKQSSADLSLQEELGVAYRKVGDIQGGPGKGNTGDTRAALVSYAKSIALLERVYAAHPNNQRVGAALAAAYVQQTQSMVYTQGVQGTEASVAKAVMLAEAVQNAEGVLDEFGRMRLLADAYWARVLVTGTSKQYDECLAAADKMIAVSEAYAQKHPDDVRGYEALSSAYSNAGILGDPRISKEEMFAHTLGLMRKALVVEEKLVVMQPDNASYASRLAESRLNIGDSLVDQGEFAEAIKQLTLALPVLKARAASDGKDMRAQLVGLMTESSLAWAQFGAGQLAEAEKGLLASEQGLAELLPRYDNLQVAFHLGQVRLRLGALHVERAGRPGLTRTTQLEHWRKARSSLAQGKADVEKVRAAIEMVGAEDEVFQKGVANLAKADAAIARLSDAR
jgi:eukaryotic-like serine/threonine-protein kinase